MTARLRKDVWIEVDANCPIEYEIDRPAGDIQVILGGSQDGVDIVFAPAALRRLVEMAPEMLAASESDGPPP